MTGLVDEILEKQNLKRQVAIALPHFLVAPFNLANTNLIATLAGRVARTYVDVLGLRILPLPFEIPGFPVKMLCTLRTTVTLPTSGYRQLFLS